MLSTRRDILKVGLSGLSVVSLGGTIPAFLSKFAYADQTATRPSMSPLSNDNILVVVQLSGGNDGLNTVIPYGNDAYLKARPVIGIKKDYLKLNDTLALNPGMLPFKEMFDNGQLAIVNGCGYPQPNRSHFRSMEIWQTADPVGHDTCGWLGHYLDHIARGTVRPGSPLADASLRAVNVGSQLPTALVTEGAPVPSIQSIDDYGVKTDSPNSNDGKLEKKIITDMNAVRDAAPALEFLARQATNAIISSDQVHKLTAGYKPDAKYPRGLGQSLQLIAQIIGGNFGTKLYYCEVGGFDTHANQVNGHQQVLANVAESISAFHKDLAVKGFNNKVTVMCFSEFGRRVDQNGSNGTDHGAAGPMFVSGGKVQGGFNGDYPSLTDLDSGDLKYTTDFRRVYSTLLEKWLNVDSAAVLGNQFETMKFV